MADFVRELKTIGITTLVEHITEEEPRVNRYPDYNEIILSDSQNKELVDFAKRMMAAKTDVRVDLSPILTPLFMERARGSFIGIGLIGVLAGVAGGMMLGRN